MDVASYWDQSGERPVVLTAEDRLRHMSIIGSSGSGKSTFAANLFLDHLYNNEGCAFIDPHGDEAQYLLSAVPKHRTEKTCYLSSDCPISYNPLRTTNIPLAARNLTAAFAGIFDTSWGPRLEWFLLNGISLLMEYDHTTLADLPALYYDRYYREAMIEGIENPTTRNFWHDEYPSYDARYQKDASGPILNKIGQFLATPLIREVLCKPKSKVDFKTMMNQEYIFISNLSKGEIGEMPANLLGSILVSGMQTAAMSRKILRTPFYLYVDEWQNFGTTAFASLIAEARKYGLSLTLANQTLSQIDEKVIDIVLGNSGTVVSFTLGPKDAMKIAPYFHPIGPHELTGLAPFHAWIKKPDQSRHMMATRPKPDVVVNQNVLAASRRRFS